MRYIQSTLKQPDLRQHLKSLNRTGLQIVAAAALTTLLSGSRAQAATYYVSPGGSDTTGTSWATAWNELAKIKWSSLAAGDTIMLGQGTYKTALTVPTNVPVKVTLTQSSEAGHDGTITVSGVGFVIQGQINIIGNGKFQNSDTLGFNISKAKTGAHITSFAGGVNNSLLSGVSFTNCDTAVTVDGFAGNPTIENCIITDSQIGIQNLPGNIPTNVYHCWVRSTKLTGAAGAQGLNVGTATMTVNNCVIGPGLGTGVSAFHGGLNMADCLLLDAGSSNFAFGNPGNSVSLRNVTSISTATGGSKTNLAMSIGLPNSPWPAGTFKALDSVVCGQQIYALPTQTPLYQAGHLNYQFDVTGNTTVLASRLTDPKFKSSAVYQLLNSKDVSINTLDNTDFSVMNVEKGMPIASVANFLAEPFTPAVGDAPPPPPNTGAGGTSPLMHLKGL